MTTLDVAFNALDALPKALGALTGLQTLSVKSNPLTVPPPDVVAQGTNAILEFLHNLPG